LPERKKICLWLSSIGHGVINVMKEFGITVDQELFAVPDAFN